MAKNDGYIGKIPNSGTMNVPAPHQMKTSHNPKVKTGQDLRCGKADKAKK